jgi:hypothetical protein
MEGGRDGGNKQEEVKESVLESDEGNNNKKQRGSGSHSSRLSS